MKEQLQHKPPKTIKKHTQTTPQMSHEKSKKGTHGTNGDDAEHLCEQGGEVHHGQRDGHLREAVGGLCVSLFS